MIHRRGPWRNLDSVEYATLEWVDWFNNRRLLEPIGNVPPAEYEAKYNRRKSMTEGETETTPAAEGVAGAAPDGTIPAAPVLTGTLAAAPAAAPTVPA